MPWSTRFRANRKALVAVNLQLTDDEAGKFGPSYDRYQKESNAVGDRLLAVIKDYSDSFPNISDDKAMKLVDDYLAIENDRVAVRRTYVPEFAKVLSGRKIARLYQIENKMDAVIRYDLAKTIPVVEEESAPANERCSPLDGAWVASPADGRAEHEIRGYSCRHPRPAWNRTRRGARSSR
jgi:hypothetical protein